MLLVPVANMDGLSEWDICCGRGKGKWNSEGNRKFRDIVENHLQQYADAPSKAEKSRIVEAVVSAVKEGGGRFVKKDDISGKWHPINAVETRAKVAHAIRDLYASSYKKKQKPDSPKAKRRRKLDSADNDSESSDKLKVGDSGVVAPDFSSSSVIEQMMRSQSASNPADVLHIDGSSHDGSSHDVATNPLVHGMLASHQGHLMPLPFQQAEQSFPPGNRLPQLHLGSGEDQQQFERRPYHPSQHLAELLTLPPRGLPQSSIGSGLDPARSMIQQQRLSDLRAMNAVSGEEKLALELNGPFRDALFQSANLRALSTATTTTRASPVVGPHATYPPRASINNDGLMGSMGQALQDSSTAIGSGQQLFPLSVQSVDSIHNTVASRALFQHHDAASVNRLGLSQPNNLETVSGVGRGLDSNELSELVRSPLPPSGFHVAGATDIATRAPSIEDFEPNAVFPPDQSD